MIYTSIVGGYDEPRSDIRVVDFKDYSDARRSARMAKILSHIYAPGDYSLWIDGNTFLREGKTEQELIWRYLDGYDIAVMKHPIRDCIYEEAKICIDFTLDNLPTIARQMTFYCLDGYPENNGLAATTYILRRHSQKIIDLNEIWWKHVQNGSVRDQLSFDYCCWKLGIKYNIIEGEWPENEYFIYKKHKKTK